MRSARGGVRSVQSLAAKRKIGMIEKMLDSERLF